VPDSAFPSACNEAADGKRPCLPPRLTGRFSASSFAQSANTGIIGVPACDAMLLAGNIRRGMPGWRDPWRRVHKTSES
jgi:hypothetical protein